MRARAGARVADSGTPERQATLAPLPQTPAPPIDTSALVSAIELMGKTLADAIERTQAPGASTPATMAQALPQPEPQTPTPPAPEPTPTPSAAPSIPMMEMLAAWVEPRQFDSTEQAVPTKPCGWEFIVKRDANGLMKRIVAHCGEITHTYEVERDDQEHITRIALKD